MRFDGLLETPATEPAVFDAEDLRERCLGHLALIERLLGSFEERFRPEVERIERAAAEGDCEEAARAAHQLKGAAANVSAERLRETLGRIERSSRSGRIEQVADSLRQLRGEWEQFLVRSAECGMRSNASAYCELRTPNSALP
jgi:HPt (histidine-containing phosphotransfer) domain-containing protein